MNNISTLPPPTSDWWVGASGCVENLRTRLMWIHLTDMTNNKCSVFQVVLFSKMMMVYKIFDWNWKKREMLEM